MLKEHEIPPVIKRISIKLSVVV